MGQKVWSSWGVADQTSKSPSRRGLQKNHDQLFFQSVDDKVKIVSILFFHVNLLLVTTHLRNISGLASKSLMGSKFGF